MQEAQGPEQGAQEAQEPEQEAPEAGLEAQEAGQEAREALGQGAELGAPWQHAPRPGEEWRTRRRRTTMI